MTKRFANAALVYALLAMAGGLFCREFTGFSGFSGPTALAVVHAHCLRLPEKQETAKPGRATDRPNGEKPRKAKALRGFSLVRMKGLEPI